MKTLKLFLVALVLNPFGLHSQCDSLHLAEFDVYIDSLVYFYNSDYNKSIAYAEKGIALMQTANCPGDYIYGCTAAARLAAHHTDLKKSKHYLDLIEKALIKEKDNLSEEDYRYSYSTFLVDKGNYLYKLGEFDKAAEVFFTLNGFLDGSDAATYELLLSSYLYLGAIYKNQGNYTKAIEYYNSSFNYSDLLGGARKGLIYKHLGDVQRTLALRKENGNIHQEEALKRYKMSYDIVKRNADLPNPPNIAVNRWLTTTEALADVYRDMGKFDSAHIYLNESLEYQRKREKQYHRTLDRQSELFFAEGKINKARSIANRSLEIKTEVFGEKNLALAKSYNGLAELYLFEKDFDQALILAQKGLINLVPDFNNEDYKTNPQQDENYSRLSLLETLHLKSRILIQKYKAEKRSDLLQIAEKTNNRSLALVDSLRIAFDAEEDKINLIELSYPIFQNAIEIAQLDGKNIEQRVYSIIEQSKAVVLKEAFKRSKIRDFNIPEEILEDESQLKYKMSYLKDKIFREQNKREPNESKIGDLSKELLAEGQKYQALQATLASQYPAYHQLVYGLSFSPLEEVQSALSEEQAIMEFFIGDDFIYRLDITKDEVGLTTVPKDFELSDWVNKLLAGIYYCKTNFGATEEACREAERNYVKYGHLIYQKLLPDFKSKYPNVERLTIIPDGVLGYLPFDALLVDEVSESDFKNYQNYPYLVRSFSVNYSYSASLYLEMLQKEDATNKRQNLLAYAPSFDVKKESNLRGINSRLLFSKLVYNVKEVENLKDLLGGHIRKGEEATKEKFLEEANDFKIIHLSSHGKINDREANYSFISFSQMDTSVAESQLLYLRELYNEKINADMVVLSACETGIGSSYRGEGMVSLARGFSFAGTKSIVTTLWQVDDKSTAKFMQNFYTELLKDNLKDVSLQSAKMKFIEDKHPIYSHPFYWAGFIPIGNMEAIVLSKSVSWFWMLGGVLLAVVLAWIVIRKRS